MRHGLVWIMNFYTHPMGSKPSLNPGVDRSGGEVILYLSEGLEYQPCQDLVNIFSNTAETVVAEVACGGWTIIIAEIYRPPRLSVAAFLSDLEEFLEEVSRNGNVCYIMGDLNINMLNFPQSGNTVDLLNILLSYSFVPLINRPTRKTATSVSLIDYIITNDSACLQSSRTDIVTNSISDHFMIYHAIALPTSVTNKANRYSLIYLINHRTLSNFKNAIARQKLGLGTRRYR